MAIATISNTGGLYSASSSWVGNFVPTSVDDVTSTITSGPLTVDIPSAAKTLNFGPYTNTLTMNSGLTVSGSVTLGLTMSISGTYGLAVISSATMSSNGKTWSNSLIFAGTSTTFTLIDDWYVDSLRYSTTNGSISTTNGKTITASNGLTVATTAQIFGTTKIILNGGNWSHTSNSGRISMPIDLNGNINFGSNIYSGGGTISYISGSISSTGNTFSFQTGTLNLVNTNSINFNNFINTGGSSLNGSNLNLLGNLTNNYPISGNSTIVMKGAGTWSGSGSLGNSITFDSGSNLVRVSGTVYYTSGTISYVSGTVSTTGSTLYLQTSGSLVSIGMDTGGMVWNDMYLHVASRDSTINLNLPSNLNISGTVYIPVSGPNSLTIPAASFYYTFSGPGLFNPTGSISIGNLFGVGGAGALQYVTLPNDITLSSFQWNSGGLAADPAGKAAIFNGGRKISVLGNFTNIGTVQTSISGNCTVELLGSGNFTLNGASSTLNLDIASSGTYSFLSTPIFSGSTIRYLSGRTSQLTSIYFIGCTLSTSGMTWSSAILRGNTGLLQELNVNNLQTETTEVRFLGTYSVNVGGNLTTNISTTGSNTVYINGTSSQTWSGTSNLANNLIINKPSGTFSISGTVYYSTGTFSYISGVVSTSNSTFAMNGSSNLSTAGITWSNISNASAGNINLLNNLTWTGTWSATTGIITFTGPGVLSPTPTTRINFSGSSAVTTPDSVIGYTFSSINITTSGITTLRGNLSTSGLLTLGGSGNINSASGLTGSLTTTGGLLTTGNCSGTAFVLLNSGTWSSTSGYLGNNLRLDGNLIISGNVYYQSGTLSYISGSISTINSTLNVGTTCNLDTNGIAWYNVTNTSIATVNLISDLLWTNNWSVTGGTLTFTGSGSLTSSSTGNVVFSGSSVITLKNEIQVVNATLGATTINSSTMSIFGNLTVNGTTTGTTFILLNGVGNQAWSGGSTLTNNLTINKSTGTFSVSGGVTYNTGTLTYNNIGASIVTTGSTLNITSTTTLNTNGINWNNIVIAWGGGVTAPVTITVTLLSNLTALGSLTFNGNAVPANLVFAGSGNITATGNLNINQLYNGGSVQLTVTFVSVVSAASLITSALNTIQYFTLNGGTLNLSGGITLGNSYSGIIGTTNIVLIGTGSINCGSGASISSIKNNLTIDTTGIITLLSHLVCSNISITYIQGSFVFNNYALYVANSYNSGGAISLSLSGDLRWYNIYLSPSTSVTVTILSNINTQYLASVGTSIINGLYNVSIINDLTVSASLSGTSNLILNGTQSQSWVSTSYLNNNLTINKLSGILSLGATTYYQSGTLSYVTGSVVTTGNTFFIGTSCFLETQGITWSNINTSVSGTTTLRNNLNFIGQWSSSSGTIVFSGAGTLNPGSTSSINFTGTSQVTIPSSFSIPTITISTSGTTTLTGGVTCSSALSTSGVINGSTMSITGNYTVTGTTTGTTDMLINGSSGQTWSHSSAVYLSNNLTIDKPSGVLTLGANIYYNTRTLTYLSGNVNALNNNTTLYVNSSATFSTDGINWYNLSINSVGLTLTISNRLTVSNNLILINNTSGGGITTVIAGSGSIVCNNFDTTAYSGNSPTVSFNGNSVYITNLQTRALVAGTNTVLNNANIYISGNITIGDSANLAPISGSSNIYYIGTGTWTTSSISQRIQLNFIINTPGKLTISGNVYYSGNITHLNGNVYAKSSTLNIIGNSTLLNFSRVNLDRVIITAGSSLVMNDFFNGSPNLTTTLSSTTTSNYTVTFTDNFEKITKFINITNCTVSRNQQLLVITDSKRSSTNLGGIRYINSVPNGIAKKSPTSFQPSGAFSAGYLMSDPAIKKTI